VTSNLKFSFDQIASSITERVDDPSTAGVSVYVGLEHLDPDTTRISRWGSVDDVQATKLRFYPGDVIYGRRRAYQRKLGVAHFDGICSAHALVLRANPEVCVPEFLPYFLHSDHFHARALSISVGSLSPTINWSTLKKEVFELPSRDEQHRAVELLSAIDTHVEYLVDFQKSASLRKMVFIRDFFQRSVASGNAVRLGDVADVLDHLRRPISATERAKRAGIVPYYGATGRTGWIDEAIFDEELVLLGEDAIDFVSANSQKAYLVAGPSWVNNHAHVLRARRESVDPIFLTEVLNSVDYRPFVSFGTRSKLTQREMLKISFILPSLADQRVFVETLSSMDQQLVCASTAIHSSRGLRMALLNGGLRQ